MFSAPHSRLHLEALNERAVPAVFGAGAFDRHFGAESAIVYTETNNPQNGQNAVLAFSRDADTGALTRIGSYATGGTGQLNVPKLMGPDDGYQEVQASANGKFLYAVNQGSDTVAAFRIKPDGGLKLIGTVASGGDQPDIIGVAGDTIYVANRGDAGEGHPGTTTPNVTAFAVNRDGSLNAIPNSTINFPVGSFVTQTLVAPNGRFLFVEAATLAGTPAATPYPPFASTRTGH